MKIKVTARRHHLEIVVITDTITAPKLIRVVNVIALALARKAPLNILVDVRAQSRDIPLLEAFSILAHAIKRKIMHTKIAYVVTGRTAPSITWFFEDMAGKRGLKIRFFKDRAVAIEWLEVKEDTLAA
jgi:hypothetical protein